MVLVLDGEYTVPQLVATLRKAVDNVETSENLKEFVNLLANSFEKAYDREHHCEKLPGNNGKGLAPRCKRLEQKVDALTRGLAQEKHEHRATEAYIDEAVVIMEHMVSVIRGLQFGSNMTSVVKKAIEEAEAFNQKLIDR